MMIDFHCPDAETTRETYPCPCLEGEGDGADPNCGSCSGSGEVHVTIDASIECAVPVPTAVDILEAAGLGEQFECVEGTIDGDDLAELHSRLSLMAENAPMRPTGAAEDMVAEILEVVDYAVEHNSRVKLT